MATVPSLKRALIERSNTTVVVVASVAAFIVVFSVVATWSLLDQFAYQNRVIDASQKALTQLKTDIQSAQSLQDSYNAFVNPASALTTGPSASSTNIIGGSTTGSGPQDGTNAKIILDALPSHYDYPALATSLENLLNNQSVQIQTIGGTDDALTQAANQANTKPTPKPMPFQVVVAGNYASVQKVITAFEHSIRPFQILTMELSGDQSQLTLTLSAQTYWQPVKSLDIKTEVIQ